MKSSDKGLKRILKAFIYSKDGFTSVFKSEEAFRQELIVCLLVLPILVFIPIKFLEKLILFISLFFVIFAELINTAIEVIIDRVSPDYHELSKKAKDIGSLLVLVSILMAILLYGAVFINHFVRC